jgi:hypothetical protein
MAPLIRWVLLQLDIQIALGLQGAQKQISSRCAPLVNGRDITTARRRAAPQDHWLPGFNREGAGPRNAGNLPHARPEPRRVRGCDRGEARPQVGRFGRSRSRLHRVRMLLVLGPGPERVTEYAPKQIRSRQEAAIGVSIAPSTRRIRDRPPCAIRLGRRRLGRQIRKARSFP